MIALNVRRMISVATGTVVCCWAKLIVAPLSLVGTIPLVPASRSNGDGQAARADGADRSLDRVARIDAHGAATDTRMRAWHHVGNVRGVLRSPWPAGAG